MTVAEYIAKHLESLHVKHVFMISGGGAMFLNDAFGHSKIKYICSHNEQASAISAEGYARTNQDLAVVCVTTGPGGINCLNGVFGQWTDSVPVLYISGQVKFPTTMASCPKITLRQLGDQEADIISLVKPITKYCAMVKKPEDIKYHLDKAIYMAANGRPGPVWLDIPINVQSAEIDESDLKPFTVPPQPAINLKAADVMQALAAGKRPLIVAGHGIRLAGMQKDFYTLAAKLNIPVVTTFNGFDLLADDNPLFAGRIGTVGQRAGNFALQKADVILFLGTRNNMRQISYNFETFAKNARKIVADIDEGELKKPTFKPDIPVHADLKDFIPALLHKAEELSVPQWLQECASARVKYKPLDEFKIKKEGPLNPYYFTTVLTDILDKDGLVVAANATACLTLFQAGQIKTGQRMFFNSGCASMGYGLPAAIGAALASGKQTICLEGDGSIMMNLQELQTVKNYNLPLKIFILNNKGYISIKQTQDNFFGRHTACGCKSGVILPDFIKIAKAFGLPAMQIKTGKNLKTVLKDILNTPGPLVCEVILEDDYIFAPKIASKKMPDGTIKSSALDDMYPFKEETKKRN